MSAATGSTIPPAVPLPPARSLGERLNSPSARLLLIGLLFLILQIPLSMIEGLVRERQQLRDAAVEDVMGAWGGRQQLVGPILRVPYQRNVVVDGKPDRQFLYAYFLPETLNIVGELRSQTRHRGIFEVPVYAADVKLEGRFRRPDFTTFDGVAEIGWAGAELVLGLSDARAIHAESGLVWAGHPLQFKPSMGSLHDDAGSAGIHAPLGRQLETPFEGDTQTFAIALKFNGAEDLRFAPVAEQTTVRLHADWPHPSFQGDWLPTTSDVRDDGFAAQWSVSYLGRDYPQRWTTANLYNATMAHALFGVDLTTPVDAYRMAERVTKYAVLTLLFTFLTVWLVEVLSARRLHAIQYLLLGSALSLFGLLQLAFAEHLGFAVAFVIAAGAIVGMVTLYCWSALQRFGRALAVGATLGGLYAYLYTLLRAEDYALLGGAVALFAALAVVMLLTRRVDWQQLGTRVPAAQA